MVTKPGLNDPCTCGSGKKYKKCCLEKDQQAEHAAFAETAARTAAYEAKSKIKRERLKTDVLAHGLKSEEFRKWHSLETDYNVVLDLIDAGSLDQAEVVARERLVRFPIYQKVTNASPWSPRLAAIIHGPPNTTARP